MVFNAVECNVLQMLPQKTMSYNYEGNDAYFSRLLNYCVNLPIIVADIHNRSNIRSRRLWWRDGLVDPSSTPRK